MLGLHPVDNVEVASTSHPDYEVSMYMATTRNNNNNNV